MAEIGQWKEAWALLDELPPSVGRGGTGTHGQLVVHRHAATDRAGARTDRWQWD